jgi:hypothetical protein
MSLLLGPGANAEEPGGLATTPAVEVPTPGPDSGLQCDADILPLLRSPAERRIEFDLPVLVGVRHFRSLRGFDDALRASGYGVFPRSFPSLGGHLGLTLGRWRLRFSGNDAWTSVASRTGTPGAVRADLFEARLDGGYDFLRWRSLTGFALLGIGGSSFSMDARAPNWNYLGAQGAALGNPSTIKRDAGLLTLQAGFEDFLPLGRVEGGTLALLVSIQAGYTQQLGLGPWFASQLPRADVPGTPDVDFSGTWVTFGAGIVWFDTHRFGLFGL